MALNRRTQLLLDIAQGMGRKKTEEELRAERYAVTDDAYIRERVGSPFTEAQRKVADSTVAQRAVQTGAGMMNHQVGPAATAGLKVLAAISQNARNAVEQERNYYADLGAITEADRKIGLETKSYADQMDAIRRSVAGARFDGTEEEQARKFEKYIYSMPETQLLQELRDKNVEGIKKNSAYEQTKERIAQAENANPALKDSVAWYENLNNTFYKYSPFDRDALISDRKRLEDSVYVIENGADPEVYGSAERMIPQYRSAIAEIDKRLRGINDPERVLEETKGNIDQLERMKSQGFDVDENLLAGQKYMQAMFTAYEAVRQDQDGAYWQSGRDMRVGNDDVQLTENPTGGQLLRWAKNSVNQSGANSALTAGELRAYDTLMGMGRKEEADAFVQAMTEKMQERSMRRVEDTWAQLASGRGEMFSRMEDIAAAQDSKVLGGFMQGMTSAARKVTPVSSAVASVITAPMDAMGTAAIIYNGTVGKMTGNQIGANSGLFMSGAARNAVRETQRQNIQNKLGGVGGQAAVFAYDTVMALGDSLVNASAGRALGLGANAATAFTASTGMGGTYREALGKTGDHDKAALAAGASFLAEYITERVPMGNIMEALDGKVTAKGVQALMKIGLNGAEEAIGEAASEYLSTAADYLILGEDSDYSERIEHYMNTGMSAEEAERKVIGEIVAEGLYSGLVGFASGGGTEAVALGVGKVQESRRAKLEKIAQEQAAQEQTAAEEKARMEQETMQSIAQGLRPEQTPEAPGTVNVQTAEEMKNAPAKTQSADEKIAQEAEMARAAQKRRQDAPHAVATDDGYMLKKNGESMNLEDADESDADVRMLHYAPGMSEAAANDMLQTYEAQEDVSVEEYAKGYKAAYDAGLRGKAYEYARRLHGEALTETQRKSAWAYGKQAMTEENTRVERLTRQNASKARFAARAGAEYKGVSFESVTREVNSEEETSLRLLDAFAKRFGLQVRVYDTLDAGRSNASYVSGTNVVKVALDATENALLRAASHEMYHYVESFSQDDAKSIRDFVLDKLKAAEEYDLDARIREVTAQYKEAGIENFDAESEIVAESMLDIIGTEENIRAMAQQNPSLLTRIKDAVERIRAFLREQLEKLAKHSDEAYALMNDEAYMQEIVQRMNDALENATRNREAMQRVGQSARQDPAVQEYLRAMETAADAQERANLLESLTHTVYARTQMNMLQQTGDYDGGYTVFRNTLKDFASGKGNLGALLTENGLDAGATEQDNAVMAYVARELGSGDGQTTGEKKQIVTARKGKKEYKWVRYESGNEKKNVITATTTEGMEKQARAYIYSEIRNGRDVSVIAEDGDILTFTRDTNHKMPKRNVYKTENGTEEMPDEMYGVKVRIIPYIDEIAMVSTRGKRMVSDGKKHRFARDGFNYRRAYFEDYNGTYYQLTISVGHTGNVKTIYNIGKIKKDAMPTAAQRPYETSFDASSRIASNNSIRQNGNEVNTEKKSLKAEDTVRKIARLRNELAEKEMRLQDVTVGIGEMQKRKEYQDIVDALINGTVSEDAYNQYVERSGMQQLSREEKQLREEIVQAKRLLEETQRQMELLREKTVNPAFRKWFGKSQVVNDDGRPKMVYHGSSAEFEEFSYDFIGKHGSAEGKGFYFTDSAQMASGYTDGYGGKLYAGWLKIENPLSNDKKTMSRAKVKKLIGMIDTTGDAIISEYAVETRDYGRPSFYRRELDTTVNAIYDGNENDAEMIAEIANVGGGMDVVAPYLRKLGYDGYVVKGKYPGATVYVAFESNQFKSVENVGTFDESTGNFYRSLKDTDTMDFFAQMSDDEYVRDAGKLINRLEEMRKQTAFSRDAWEGKTAALSKQLLEETHSSMNQGALTRRINAMYRAMDAGDMSANQLMEYAYDIAQKVAEGAGQVQELGEGEKEARDYIRNTRIYLNGDMQSQVRARYGSMRPFMNRNFGRARFTSNSKATSLEEMWPELAQMAPGYFPAETDVSAMPEVLEVFLDATGKVNRDYFGANEAQMKQDVAIRLFWEYYRMPGTYADLEAQKQSMVQELSDLQDSMRASFDQRVEEKVQRILKREQREKDIAAIRRKRMVLAKRYNIPTRDKHIPEQLRGAVKLLLDVTEKGGGEEGKVYAELAGELRRIRSEDPETMVNISTDLEGILDQLQEAAKGKTPAYMTPDEAEGLRTVTEGIHHACVVADKILTEGQKGSVREIAMQMHKASSRRADRKVLGEKRAALKGIKYNLMDAPRFFRELQRYMGDGAKDLWRIVRHGGFDKMARNLDEAAQLMESKIGKYDYRTWTGKNAQVHEVQVNGEKVQMTTGQIMSLYMLNQREQARSHLYGAGGTGEDGGIIAGRVTTRGGTVEGTKPHTVTPEQVDRICDKLTKEQKQCANALGEIMSTWCAEKGNETSRGLYGYDMYKERHYFPIEVWGGRKNVTQEEQNTTNMYQLMNKGWTKNLVKKAQAPIVIHDIFDVTGKHINEVIMYNSWALPVRDVLQVMNYKGKELMTFDMEQKQILPFSEELMGTNDSVRADIERVMGKDAFNYLTQMIKDINGMVVNKVEKGYASASGKMLRNFKATAVGFNLGTVVKQPTSVMRAFEVIPAHYFVGGKTEHDGKTVDLIKQYAPVMTWKQYGYFTMDTGKSTQSALFPKTEDWRAKVSDVSMWGAGKADEITWVQIWKAAERMTKSRNSELKAGSDAFYRQAAEYFNECIDRTQTVDSVLHRSELMRQKTEWVKVITTFMGEPLKTMNMLIDSYNNLRASNTGEAKRQMAKTSVYFAGAAVVTSFVNSLVSTLRNWDDEDPFWDQVMGRWLGEYEEDMSFAAGAQEFLLNSELMSELNVLNKIPIAKDLMEMLRGYDINRMDMDTISAVMDAAQGMFNEKLTWERKTLNLLGAVGNAFGIPANNIIKEVRNMWNITMRAAEKSGVNTLPMQYALIRFEKEMNQKNMSDYARFIVKAEAQGKEKYAEEVRQALLDADMDGEKLAAEESDYLISDATGMRRQDVTYEKTYAALGEAIRAKDMKLQQLLRNALRKKGKTDEDVAEGLKKYLTEDKRVMEAAQRAIAGDENAKMNMYKTLRAEGFDDETVKKAVNSVYNQLYKEKYKTKEEVEKETEEAYEPMWGYNDLHVAVEEGDAQGVSDVLEELRKAGKSDSNIKSALTSRIKPVYVALASGSASDKAKAKRIRQMLLQIPFKNKYTEEAIEEWLKK